MFRSCYIFSFLSQKYVVVVFICKITGRAVQCILLMVDDFGKTFSGLVSMTSVMVHINYLVV